eukprot:PhF_6_TR14261/c0_g1_i3/m.22926
MIPGRLIGPSPPPGSCRRKDHSTVLYCGVTNLMQEHLQEIFQDSSEALEAMYHAIVNTPLLSTLHPVVPLLDFCDLASDDDFTATLTQKVNAFQQGGMVEDIARVVRILIARRMYYHQWGNGGIKCTRLDMAPYEPLFRREEVLQTFHVMDPLPPNVFTLQQAIDHVAQSSQSISSWFYYATTEEIHDVYTVEFVELFRELLLPKILSAVTRSNNNDCPTLEIGAGRGRLRAALHGLFTSYIATDILAFADAGVVAMDYKVALKHYQPTIVIASWIPAEEDWVSVIEDTPSVAVYILIGHPALTGRCVVDQRNDYPPVWDRNGNGGVGGKFHKITGPESRVVGKAMVC